MEEVRLFLAQSNIPLESSLTAWWRNNAASFPENISQLPNKFMGILPHP